ncbi:hypothetical protein BS47DRAFT_807445 [Hydnum rufescens UP504]|uniref:Uncharacterized protein n=1 Tax=Hydnum rufescens UP504 TaxID=1448309 RepID=A0A9P6B065_9AGAM|nr:hypothetical protein BS47DRAFT_807445 [Hydnum rufescens UP504]
MTRNDSPIGRSSRHPPCPHHANVGHQSNRIAGTPQTSRASRSSSKPASTGNSSRRHQIRLNSSRSIPSSVPGNIWISQPFLYNVDSIAPSPAFLSNSASMPIEILLCADEVEYSSLVPDPSLEGECGIVCFISRGLLESFNRISNVARRGPGGFDSSTSSCLSRDQGPPVVGPFKFPMDWVIVLVLSWIDSDPARNTSSSFWRDVICVMTDLTSLSKVASERPIPSRCPNTSGLLARYNVVAHLPIVGSLGQNLIVSSI